MVLFQHLPRVNVENHEKSIKTANVPDGFIDVKRFKKWKVLQGKSFIRNYLGR